MPDAAAVAELLALTREVGSAVLLAGPEALSGWQHVWGPPPADLPLMRRVKAALDGGSVFASGRYVGGL